MHSLNIHWVFRGCNWRQKQEKSIFGFIQNMPRAAHHFGWWHVLESPLSTPRSCISVAVTSGCFWRGYELLTTSLCLLEQLGLSTRMYKQILFYTRFLLFLFYITVGALCVNSFEKLCVEAGYSIHGVHSRVLKRILHVFNIRRKYERVENQCCRAFMKL